MRRYLKDSVKLKVSGRYGEGDRKGVRRKLEGGEKVVGRE